MDIKQLWSPRAKGEEGEARALRHLEQQGLKLVARNYRIGGGPRRPAGEIDLIMRDGPTLVFVEVRSRQSSAHGGALASIGLHKQRRIIRAAQHYLMRLPEPPPCRFDVVALEGDTLKWLPAAFDLG